MRKLFVSLVICAISMFSFFNQSGANEWTQSDFQKNFSGEQSYTGKIHRFETSTEVCAVYEYDNGWLDVYGADVKNNKFQIIRIHPPEPISKSSDNIFLEKCRGHIQNLPSKIKVRIIKEIIPNPIDSPIGKWEHSPIKVLGLKGDHYLLRLPCASCAINIYADGGIEISANDAKWNGVAVYERIQIGPDGARAHIEAINKKYPHKKRRGYKVYIVKCKPHLKKLPPDVQKIIAGM